MTKTLRVNLTPGYDIYVGNGVRHILGEKIDRESKIIVISDTNVFALYGNEVTGELKKQGINVCDFVIAPGENSKSPEVLLTLWNYLAENGFGRNDTVIALGGGVVGDVSGFAAATYMRGMRFVQMPTSLLSMVDSSVGGKTAVNLDAGKNTVGSFYQPDFVIIDTDFLDTLSEKEYANGMAEAIKCGMIKKDIRKLIENGADISEIICECVALKAGIVEKDEHDTGIRHLLNFGHTVGHAIEKVSGFTVSHGEAVSIGMAKMTELSLDLGLCKESTYTGLIKILEDAGLPVKTDLDTEDIIRAISKDKKVADSNISVILALDDTCIVKDYPLNFFTDMLRKANS